MVTVTILVVEAAGGATTDEAPGWPTGAVELVATGTSPPAGTVTVMGPLPPGAPAGMVTVENSVAVRDTMMLDEMAGASLTGQMVVLMPMVLVTRTVLTAPEGSAEMRDVSVAAGQLVISGAQEIMVLTVVAMTVSVVKLAPSTTVVEELAKGGRIGVIVGKAGRVRVPLLTATELEAATRRELEEPEAATAKVEELAAMLEERLTVTAPPCGGAVTVRFPGTAIDAEAEAEAALEDALAEAEAPTGADEELAATALGTERVGTGKLPPLLEADWLALDAPETPAASVEDVAAVAELTGGDKAGYVVAASPTGGTVTLRLTAPDLVAELAAETDTDTDADEAAPAMGGNEMVGKAADEAETGADEARPDADPDLLDEAEAEEEAAPATGGSKSVGTADEAVTLTASARDVVCPTRVEEETPLITADEIETDTYTTKSAYEQYKGGL